MDTGLFTLFGLLSPAAGSVWWLSILALFLLLLVWLRLAIPSAAGPIRSLPVIWLYWPLAGVTLLASLLAATWPALFLTWSLLLLAWMTVSLMTLGPGRTWRFSGWLWMPLGFWAVVVSVTPSSVLPYGSAPALPFSIQLLVGVGLLLPCVCWPLWGWRPVMAGLPRLTALLLLLWPAVAAGGLLGRWLWAIGTSSLWLGVLLLGGLFVGLRVAQAKQLLAGLNLPLTSLRAILTGWGHKLSQAFYDALLLLEGEAGLLWLLGLLVLALLFN
jgi:hypothetical protein